MNEWNHYSADIVVKKLLEEGVNLEKALDIAAWTHNPNVNRIGYDLMSLVTGKSVIFPGISQGNVVIESMYEDE